MNQESAQDRTPPIKPPLLSEVFFENLRDQILSGRLKPGQRLSEIALQKELDTSRSPVREAIRRLEMEGLVGIKPRRGAFVIEPSAEDMRDAVQVRAQLEALAATLAAERRSDRHLKRMAALLEEMDESLDDKDVERYTKAHHRFHQCLARATGNQTLERHLRMISQPFTVLRLTYIYLMRQGPRLEANHNIILRAIADQDGRRAGELAKRHVLALLEMEPEVAQGP